MSWQSHMENENRRFRGLWADHGQDYLYGDWLSFNPPMADGSHTVESVDRRIDDMFTKFSAGHKDEVESIMVLLGRSHRTLEEDFAENTDGLLEQLDDWAGEGAERFRRYMREMKSAVDLKKNSLLAAEKTIEAYRELLEEYHRAIDELIRNTDAALDEVRQGNKDAEYEFSFGVAVAVAGVVGATVASGGLALGAAATALSAGAASSATALIGGPEEGGVIVSMVEIGEKIIEDAETSARHVRNACFEITTFFTTYSGSRPDEEPYGDNETTDLEEIRPDRPELITDQEFDPEEFRPDDAEAGDVAGLSRYDLVLNPERDGDDPHDYELRDPRGGQSPALPTPPVQPGPSMPGEGIQPDPAEPVPTPDFYPEQGGSERPEPIEGFIPPTT
jgi:hypothetical protein